MRNLFLLLLLANICFGLWLYSQEQERLVKLSAPLPQVSNSLVLLSELAEPAVEVVVEPEEAASPEPAEPKPSEVAENLPELQAELIEEAVAAKPRECYTLGPFTSASKSKRAQRLLRAVDAEVEKRTRQEQLPYGYRVYIPPLSSRERAYAVAEQLRASGVKDYFVITNPNDKLNGVSLGLFSQKTGALKRVAKLRNLNYQASIEVRYKDKAIVWLDYSAEQGRVDAQVLREVGEGVLEMQHLPRDC